MSENTAIWDQVCETDPSTTKEVSFGRKFTALDAYHQIKKATEVFGPVGKGWGWTAKYQFTADLCVAVIDMWHSGNPSITFTTAGCAPLTKTAKGKVSPDDDAPKKALTDGITKGLSYLGFNADVFLGKFDDNKYVAEMREKHNPSRKATPATTGQAAILQQIHAIGSKIYDDWKYECGAICAEVTKETTPDNIRNVSTTLTMPELKEVLARINTDKTAREQAE